ncbi:hypothetical protein ACIBCM_17030 [Streptomyces sp. NPDC051018]|uniref:hypothetical protein n=1 Tax=Streptomyces sp. NPDC051018 TaxID=3365639 RepID=UPI0037A7C86F
MDTEQPQAGIVAKVFDGLTFLLPDWLEIPLLCLVVALVVWGWVSSLRNKLARRRAARTAPPPAAHGSGADYLGPYAPQAPAGAPRPQGGPQGQAGGQPQDPPRGPSGADFLGSYAPPGHRDGRAG